MIGRLDPASREVTIVGAGFAGLLAAYHLDRAGCEVTLLEASPRAGGLLRTVHTPFGIAEAAAHSFLATDSFRAVCADLSIELVEVRPGSRARYIWRSGGLRRIALGPWEILRTLARAYFVLARARGPAPMTMEEWGLRHLGRSAVSYLLTPFLRGIYGARPRELSVSAAFPSLLLNPGNSLISHFLARAWRGRATRGKAAKRIVMAPAGGMESVVAALEKRLGERLGSRFRKNETVRELPSARNLILAVPAAAAAILLERPSPELAGALRTVRYAPLLSATVFVRKEKIARPVQGVGVLMPEEAPFHCLGVLFNSSAFPGRVRDERAAESFTAMYGGTSRPELLELSDAEVHELVAEDFRKLFGIAADAIAHVEIHRWKNAVPRYDGRLEDVWNEARRGWCARPGRLLFGNFSGQVSLRGMAESARELAAGLQNPPGECKHP